MRSANDIRNSLNAKKEEKYYKLMKIQEKIIEDGIKAGDHSRLFIFTDIGYFHDEIERGWYKELFDRAVKEMTDAGYKLSGICVYW